MRNDNRYPNRAEMLALIQLQAAQRPSETQSPSEAETVTLCIIDPPPHT